ncbi:MAG: hypothetical protein ACRDH0_01960 [Actinomycetota bacterium]
MASGPPGRRQAAGLLLALSAALVLGACREKQATIGGGPTFSITSPADGESVTSPVALVLSVQGVEIGSPETGLMHFHVHVDGSSEYDVVTSTSAEVEVPPGQHTVELVLAQPNHAETDTTVSISVNVTGSSPSDGGGGYGGGGYGGGG